MTAAVSLNVKAAENADLVSVAAEVAFANDVLHFLVSSLPKNLQLSQSCKAFFDRLSAARGAAGDAAWQTLTGTTAVSGDFSAYPELPCELSETVHPGRLYFPPSDTRPEAVNGSAAVALSNHARSHFVLREIGPELDEIGATEGLLLHIVMSIELAAQDDPRAGIRVFLGGSHEETLVRFRDGGVVFLQETRSPLPAGGRPFLLSIGVFEGRATVYCDGMPVHRKACVFPSITGFLIDIASQSERECRAKFHSICLQRGGERPFWTSLNDETALANACRAAALTRPRAEQLRLLHALSGFPGDLQGDSLIGKINENRLSEPYLPQIDDLLLKRIPAEVSGRFAVEAAPAPLVKVSNAVVTLASNPGGHSLWPFGAKHERKYRRVLDGVSFDAYKGDIIGVLGRNGAGKSTLLKTMVGAMPPTEGRIEITGKPVLLRPDAGMQPTLTGRQNIVKSGLYMDLLPREIEEKMPGIAAFAELEEHLDRPFKYYSDGMKSLLIFSIATAMPYDILLLDELLGAGDIGFQRRVTERLDRVIESAKVLFVVQHSFNFVISRCTKCLVLDDGKPIFFGDPQIASELYRERVS
jgi:ABC-type polysaccharide/polyol phosphate transport system ATPase subunit